MFCFSERFLSVSEKEPEMSKYNASPQTSSTQLHTLGIWLLICIYWNIAQLLRGSISHPEDDKTNDTEGGGGSQ